MALDYPLLNLSDSMMMAMTSTGMQPNTDTTSISSSNIVSSSLFVAEGLDVCSTVPPPMNDWSGPDYTMAPLGASYPTPPHLQLSTPDNSPRLYPNYLPPHPCNPLPPVSTQLHGPPAPPLPPVRDLFFCGSSLEESPISSPGDLEREPIQPSVSIAGDMQKMSHLGVGLLNLDSANSGDEEMTFCHTDRPRKIVPDGIKMPQRKGGMQLWQFLYSMLTDANGKYRNLIEWTHTAKERQFRLLEPDAIAVWWGHHKNKPNMSYDKLSRSLRYYYDKGIIRKISGERFVYRFCIDPEVMYKHMGTSNARPQLKPMPQDAKIALNKDRTMVGAKACVALEAESLQSHDSVSSETEVHHVPATLPPLFVPPSASFSNSLSVPATVPPLSSSPMRRCHSYDSAYQANSISPVETPSTCPSSFGGFPSVYDNFTSTFSHSPNNSPPHSATMPFTTRPSELSGRPLPYNEFFTTFPSLTPAISTTPPFTSAYQ